MAGYTYSLTMTISLLRRVNEWRGENPDPETGKLPTFKAALTTLIEKGLGETKE